MRPVTAPPDSKGLSGIPASIFQLVLITTDSVGRGPATDAAWGLFPGFPCCTWLSPSHQFSHCKRAGGTICDLNGRRKAHRASPGPGSSKCNTLVRFCQTKEELQRKRGGESGRLSSNPISAAGLTWAVLISSLGLSSAWWDLRFPPSLILYAMNNQTCTRCTLPAPVVLFSVNLFKSQINKCV